MLLLSRLGFLILMQSTYVTPFDMCPRIMYLIWDENICTHSLISLMTPWCPPKMLELHKAIILSWQFSGIAMIAGTFLGVVLSLNNKESSNKYLSANV